MNSEPVTVVRIYVSEGQGKVDALLKRLHDWEHLRGVTVFRGISGFGESSPLRTSKLLDLSLDLPVVIEFFDAPDKIARVLEHLENDIQPHHIIWWTAQMNAGSGA